MVNLFFILLLIIISPLVICSALASIVLICSLIKIVIDYIKERIK